MKQLIEIAGREKRLNFNCLLCCFECEASFDDRCYLLLSLGDELHIESKALKHRKQSVKHCMLCPKIKSLWLRDMDFSSFFCE
jgi:hypothetical protein